MTERHEPRLGEFYDVTEIKGTETTHRYRVDGQVQGKVIQGTLSLFIEDGDYDGYDWSGTDLDDDEVQEILDLFGNA